MTVAKNSTSERVAKTTIPSFGKRFTDVSKLGSGTFGSVYKAYDKEKKQLVAIKQFVQVNNHLGVSMLIIREISILSQLNHPSILKTVDVLLGKTIDKNSLLLITELEDIDLETFQHEVRSTLQLSMVRCIMKQLVDGFSYLHSRHIMHRDLKPDNILICRSNLLIKIADFGYARNYLHTITKTARLQSYSFPIQAPDYRAPEVALGSHSYTPAVDVWSIGCIFGELLCGGNKLFYDYSPAPTPLHMLVPVPMSRQVKRMEVGKGGEEGNGRIIMGGNKEVQDGRIENNGKVGNKGGEEGREMEYALDRKENNSLIKSFAAIFKLLGPLPPSMHQLPAYKSIQSIEFTSNYPNNSSSNTDNLNNYNSSSNSSQDLHPPHTPIPACEKTTITALQSVMILRLRSLSATKLLIKCLELDPCKRIDCYTASAAEFFSETE